MLISIAGALENVVFLATFAIEAGQASEAGTEPVEPAGIELVGVGVDVVDDGPIVDFEEVVVFGAVVVLDFDATFFELDPI